MGFYNNAGAASFHTFNKRLVFSERVFHIEHQGRFVINKPSYLKEHKKFFRYRTRGRNEQIKFDVSSFSPQSLADYFCRESPISYCADICGTYLYSSLQLRGPPSYLLS